MNIDNIKYLITLYHNQNLNELSSNLNNIDNRIKFEEWLLSQAQDKPNDDIWKTRVIILICTKASKDPPSTVTNKEEEDRHLAKLITHLNRHPKDVKQTFADIQKSDLPETCNALFKKIVNTQTFDIQQTSEKSNQEKDEVTLKNNNEDTLDSFIIEVKNAIQNNNIKDLTLIAKQNPDFFTKAITSKDYFGNTPLLVAITNNQSELVESIAQFTPEAFSAAVSISNNLGKTPLFAAVENNNLNLLKAIAKANPLAFEKFMITNQSRGESVDKINAVHAAIENKNLEALKFMAETAPETFKKAMITKSHSFGLTPLAVASKQNNIEMLKFMYETAPESLKKAATLKNMNHETPLLEACNHHVINIDLLKLLIEINPEALHILDNHAHSPLSLIKAIRPENYREAVLLINHNSNLKQHHLTLVARKALSHAWHISGKTYLTKVENNEVIAKMDLEGHHAYEWFNLMKKDFLTFKELYPALLNQNQIHLLRQVFDLGANEHLYSHEDKVNRIKEGLPVIMNTGFKGHAVTVLIWGDQFVICNRGGESRRPVDVFHFNPEKIDVETLKMIEDCGRKGDKKTYQTLFFTTLDQKLQFSKSESDHQMNDLNALPMQTVGNCTFVSSTTAIYAFILLGKIRGSDEFGHFVNQGLLTEGNLQQAVEVYQTWLSHLQISFLEKNIPNLEKRNTAFVPDHPLIVSAFRKAHLLPLDDYNEKRLEKITADYISTLEKKLQTKMMSDLIYWKTLKKTPLL